MTVIHPTPLTTKEIVERNNRNLQLAKIEKIKSLPPITYNPKLISNSDVYMNPLPCTVELKNQSN